MGEFEVPILDSLQLLTNVDFGCCVANEWLIS